MNIVIIDSGTGAEEITKTLLSKDLSNNYILLLDKSFFPYGDKTKVQLNDRFDYLNSMIPTNTDIVIIACNTLSILLDKRKLNCEYIDMISITKKYILKNKYTKILLLGTKNTVENNPFNTTNSMIVDKLINAIQNNNYIEELDNVLNCIEDNYEVIILGCTHLIKVKNEFRSKFKCDIISQDELIILPRSLVKIKEV